MPSQARLSPAARREQLLFVARDLLRSHPAGEVTVEAVATTAGVSPGLVFHYFGSQREFRRAVIEVAVAELLSALQPSPGLSPADQLRAGLDKFTQAVAGSPELFLAVVRPGSGLADVHSGFRSVVGDWLRTGLGADGTAVTPVLDAALSGWLAFTEDVILRWVTSDALTRQEVVELCSRACLGFLDAAAIPESGL
ncbi:MAG: TetR/AcrR family transcriptional regulator [Streptosporangiaceae bacterium]|jgi:AcrR family transcriptional regulator